MAGTSSPSATDLPTAFNIGHFFELRMPAPLVGRTCFVVTRGASGRTGSPASSHDRCAQASITMSNVSVMWSRPSDGGMLALHGLLPTATLAVSPSVLSIGHRCDEWIGPVEGGHRAWLNRTRLRCQASRTPSVWGIRTTPRSMP